MNEEECECITRKDFRDHISGDIDPIENGQQPSGCMIYVNSLPTTVNPTGLRSGIQLRILDFNIYTF